MNSRQKLLVRSRLWHLLVGVWALQWRLMM